MLPEVRRVIPRLKTFEGLVLAASFVSFLVLILLRGILEDVPMILFACTAILFLVPGSLVSRWFASEVFSGAAIIPAAFALSTGIFGLLGVPFLILNLTLRGYLVACGVVVGISLVATVVHVARSKPRSWEKSATDVDVFSWLWVPFLALAGILTQAATVARVDGDTWNYLAWVREYLNADKLAFYDPYLATPAPEFSRTKVNSWMLEQAGLARVTGIDPIPLVLDYLAPSLVFVSLLAVYALARLILESRGAALLTGIVYSLFMLAYLQVSQFSIGGEFLSRAVQDKDVTRFIFLPIALCFAAAWLEKRRFAHLLLFGFLCWAVVTVHPAGLAVIGLATAGFGLFHVVAHPRAAQAWTRAVALGAALLSILVIPLLYILVAGKPLSSALYSADISGSDPAVLANQVFVRNWFRIYQLEDGYYIMHPFLLQNPVIIAGYVLGVPFLIWHLRRSVAAQLLLGSLFAATVVCYVPPVATFVGDNIVAPGQLYRLSWPILLAAPVVLGWIAWKTIRFIAERFSLRPATSILVSLTLVIALTAAATPSALAGLKEVHREGSKGRSDPVFWWLHRNIDEPSVILATDPTNTAIPAFSADANVISFRGAPVLEKLSELERLSGENIEVKQGSLDVQAFFEGPTIGEAYDILRRNKVDYVMVRSGGPLASSMKDKPPFKELDTPSKGYAVFAVDREKLDES